MHKEIFLNFLQKHNIYNKEVLEYFYNNSTFVNYKDENEREFIGCYPKVENSILTKVKICVPKIEDDISASINLHEYIHLLTLFNKLNKEYEEMSHEEVLPIFYELVFMNENIKDLSDYYKYYGDYLIKNNYEDYNLAMELLKKITISSKKMDINSLNQELKKVSR